MNSIIDNCPDGLDCPMYDECHEDKCPEDGCPLVEKFIEPTVPLDKIITNAY
jgi:hypothetical protein